MGADQITFDKEADRYTAEGSIRYQGSGLRMVAARAEGNQGTETHVIHDLDYQLLSRRGNGGADSVTLAGELGTLRGATYSTCPPEARQWELRARQIDIDTEEGMAVARGATLRVGKVPVFAVYFALDEMGDSITPVDTCFWSPFLAMAMIDQYVALNEHERKAYWKQQGAWPMIHQNYSAQHQLPMLVDTLRNVAAECSDPDLDLMYGDASEFGREMAKRIKKGLETLHHVPKPQEGEERPTARSV